MNDYKDVIQNLHICVSGDCCCCTLRDNKTNCQEVLLEYAANTIEQLINERDKLIKERQESELKWTQTLSSCLQSVNDWKTEWETWKAFQKKDKVDNEETIDL